MPSPEQLSEFTRAFGGQPVASQLDALFKIRPASPAQPPPMNEELRRKIEALYGERAAEEYEQRHAEANPLP